MFGQIDLTQLQVTPSLDWREAFGLWLRRTPSQKRQERSRLSVEAYAGDVEQMSRWFEARYEVAFDPSQINSANLQEYFAEVADACAPATYNRRRASVRLLIKWCREAGVLDYDPSEWIPAQDATRESPRDMCEEDRVLLEMAAEEGEGSLIGLRDSVMFFLMNSAGLRISEVIGLRLSDLHLDEGYIHVLGKGRKHRNVKVGGRLAEKLRVWLERKPDSVEGTLITSEHGLAITRGQAWRRFVSIAEAAGVDASPHDMRHTFILRYMDAVMGGDPSRLPAAIDAVCQQTGDRPEVILKYYTRARESDLRAAAEVM
jgi:integrase/recombinase XerD